VSSQGFAKHSAEISYNLAGIRNLRWLNGFWIIDMNLPWKRKAGNVNFEELPDQDLVRLAKHNREVFGVLYERYITKIYNYIYYRTGNHHDAEDLTAAVFHRAMKHIENYTDRGVPFQAWLYRIAHNLVANWHRDRSRRKIIALEDFIGPSLDDNDGPDFHTELKEERDALLQAIRHLPEERQQLLLLKFIDRRSNAEIGEIMGRTEGAIKSLYHRTLNALRDDDVLRAMSDTLTGADSANDGKEDEENNAQATTQ
jgi:RNA polymerase sigma-70 factor (ECF subfamily)